MVDVAALCTGISVCFASSCTLRSLLPRLTETLAEHLPVVEVEADWRTPTEDSVTIEAIAPAVERRWSGRRSARYFYQKAVSEPTWLDDGDPARVAFTPIDLRLTVPVGRAGLLSVSFSTQMEVLDVEDPNTEKWVEVLALQARRLGQLDATARIAHAAHRKISELEARLEALESRTSTEIPVPSPDAGVARAITEIPVSLSIPPKTEIPVRTMEDAMVECISRALHAAHGRIYGDHGAAKLLGLKPSTLQSKMRKLGIDRQHFVG